MAKAASKAAALTTLAIGKVEVSVGLFTAHADPKKKLVEFDTAGPNGGVLKMRSVARPTPVDEAVERPDEPVFADPLAVGDPGSDAPPEALLAALDAHEDAAAAQKRAGEMVAAAVDGEYGQELVEDGTGEVVRPEQVRRGVRLEDGSFIDCTAQLAEISEITKLDRMRVVGFIDITHVPRARGKAAYYVGAQDEKAPPALRLIYEALRATRRAAVVKLTKRSRQSLAVIAPWARVLVLYELVWAEDFREPPAKALAIQKAQVSEISVRRAVELVGAMAEPPGVIDELRDDAIALREELHARALRGEIEAIEADRVAREEDDSLMAALEESLAVAVA